MTTTQPRGAGQDGGFTLVELLVVMVVVGVLAGIAVPAFLGQKRRAYEASAKQDVKAIAKEVVGYYVGDDGALTLTAPSTGGWTLTGTAGTVASGRLSAGNSLGASTITSDTAYCVAVVPSYGGARTWRATSDGLAAGPC